MAPVFSSANILVDLLFYISSEDFSSTTSSQVWPTGQLIITTLAQIPYLLISSTRTSCLTLSSKVSLVRCPFSHAFELLLRLKANYLWPAMWFAMFDVDGLNVSNGLPQQPIAGPNQVLADMYGIVMGTSHEEPMARKPRSSNYSSSLC
jgi:hypothetical protein